MSEYEQVIDEIVKHGVVVKINKVVDDNYIPCERKYVGCVVELDFTEHDKVFEDKIELLNRNLNLQKDKRCEAEIERNYLAERFNQLKDENDELKQRIAELDSKETVDLPFDPLETANMLINATYSRKANGIDRLRGCEEDTIETDMYLVKDLEQIAEHLLVYCRHNKESEE